MTKTCTVGGATVIAFAPVAARTKFWTKAACFDAQMAGNAANDSHAPTSQEGAQTSDLVLEFLQNVTRQA